MGLEGGEDNNRTSAGGGGRNFPEEEVVGYRCSRRLVREDPNTGDSVRARFEG